MEGMAGRWEEKLGLEKGFIQAEAEMSWASGSRFFLLADPVSL